MTEISKKQYILSSQKLNLEMKEQRVGKWYLYTDKCLNVSENKTADGRKIWLLGNAFCTNKEQSVEEDIEAFSGEDFTGLTRNWTGRWVLLTENELFTDATGLMSAFYDRENKVISSSLALIAQITGKECQRKVGHYGINWQILPDTLVDGVKALLATQKIIFAKDGFEVVFDNWTTDYRHLSTDEKCQITANILITSLKNINSFSKKKIVLALTGGNDSRVTLAALLKSGVPFSCYTSEHSAISSGDKKIPKKLAKRFDFAHTYIKKNKFDEERQRDYYQFTAQNSDGADAVFYACGQFDSFGKDAVVIRSGLYEAGQIYARRYTKPNIQGFMDGMAAFYSDLRNDENQKRAFEDWVDEVKQNPIDYIDIRDRFYIEQRVGGWAAAIEQSLDMNEFTSIQIVNCAELLSIFLSCNAEERTSFAIARGVMKILEPEILRFDINKTTLFDKIGIVIRAIKKRLKRR